MASFHYLLPFFLLLSLETLELTQALGSDPSADPTAPMVPFPCSNRIPRCGARLYHINNNNFTSEEIASIYAVNQLLHVRPISRGDRQDYLVTVPCSCNKVKGTRGYFYDTHYKVKPKDTFVQVSDVLYSGQAWRVGGEERSFIAGDVVTMHLLCGCAQAKNTFVVTYTVQQQDTLSTIAAMFSAKISDIQKMNPELTQNPDVIQDGWVLYVPMQIH